MDDRRMGSKNPSISNWCKVETGWTGPREADMLPERCQKNRNTEKLRLKWTSRGDVAPASCLTQGQLSSEKRVGDSRMILRGEVFTSQNSPLKSDFIRSGREREQILQCLLVPIWWSFCDIVDADYPGGCRENWKDCFFYYLLFLKGRHKVAYYLTFFLADLGFFLTPLNTK